MGIDLQAGGMGLAQGFGIDRIDRRGGAEALAPVGPLHHEEQDGAMSRCARGEQFADMAGAARGDRVGEGAAAVPGRERDALFARAGFTPIQQVPLWISSRV
jgi:hypothetical protein